MINKTHKTGFTADEKKIYQQFFDSLKIPTKKLKSPIYICLFGKIGAGKSTVAKKIAKKIPLVIIRSDTVRYLFISFYKKKKIINKRVKKIYYRTIRELLSKNHSLIIDAGNQSLDDINRHKEITNNFKASLVWLNIFCPEKTILKRFKNKKSDFNTIKKGNLSNKYIYSQRKFLYLKNLKKINPIYKINTAKPLDPQINESLELIQKK